MYILQNEQHRHEIAQLKAINQEHLESLRRKEAKHRAELEKRQRIEWRAHQEQVSKIIKPLQDLLLIYSQVTRAQ